MRDQLGNQLLDVMREIKRAFDPKNVFNPGKIFADGSEPDGHQHKIDNHLRENFTRPLELPFQPVLAFAFKDSSFTGNLEQCNGCGGCLKQSDIMCPTFIATHDEVMSTRGRANIIRAALELRTNGHDPLKSDELDAALSNCLSCKGCTPECPSNVNLALLKAEMLHARWRRDGLPLRERILSNVDLLGKLGCLMPRLTNRLLGFKAARIAMEKTIGIPDDGHCPITQVNALTDGLADIVGRLCQTPPTRKGDLQIAPAVTNRRSLGSEAASSFGTTPSYVITSRTSG